MQSIILAGGMGTRLTSILPNLPKPMAPIRSKPFLAILIEYLSSQNVNDIVLAVGHKHDVITNYFGEKYGSATIRYSIEHKLLGTGGAIHQAMQKTAGDPVFIINGDTFVKIDYRAMMAKHDKYESSSSMTIALKQVPDVTRYGNVGVENNCITAFHEKGAAGPGLINTGVYVFSKTVFDKFNLPEVFSFEKDFLYPYAQAIKPQAFMTDAYFIDIGVPEDYKRAQLELIN